MVVLSLIILCDSNAFCFTLGGTGRVSETEQHCASLMLVVLLKSVASMLERRFGKVSTWQSILWSMREQLQVAMLVTKL